MHDGGVSLAAIDVDNLLQQLRLHKEPTEQHSWGPVASVPALDALESTCAALEQNMKRLETQAAPLQPTDLNEVAAVRDSAATRIQACIRGGLVRRSTAKSTERIAPAAVSATEALNTDQVLAECTAAAVAASDTRCAKIEERVVALADQQSALQLEFVAMRQNFSDQVKLYGLVYSAAPVNSHFAPQVEALRSHLLNVVATLPDTAAAAAAEAATVATTAAAAAAAATVITATQDATGASSDEQPPGESPLLPLPLCAPTITTPTTEHESTERFLQAEHEARQGTAFADLQPPASPAQEELQQAVRGKPQRSNFVSGRTDNGDRRVSSVPVKGAYTAGDSLPAVAWEMRTPPRNGKSSSKGRHHHHHHQDLTDQILQDLVTPPVASPIASTPSPPKHNDVQVIDLLECPLPRQPLTSSVSVPGLPRTTPTKMLSVIDSRLVGPTCRQGPARPQ